MIRKAALPLAVLGLLVAMSPSPGLRATSPAMAATLVATVNDDPITSYDIEQRIKLQRLLKRPATADAALEGIIADRLRLREMKRYNLIPGTPERNNGIAKVAAEMKVPGQALLQSLQSSALPEKDWGDFFKAEGSWILLARALNKGLEVSEREVRAELDKRGQKATPIEYMMRQVVLIVPISAGPEQWQARARDAEQLRTRFADCTSGIGLVRAMPETVVREQFARTGNSMPDELRAVLERTPVGRLTPPQRGSTGIEMVALCAKSELRDDAVKGEEIRSELLSRKLDGISTKMYADLRARAIVVKR